MILTKAEWETAAATRPALCPPVPGGLKPHGPA